jgi:hypothetical protein
MYNDQATRRSITNFAASSLNLAINIFSFVEIFTGFKTYFGVRFTGCGLVASAHQSVVWTARHWRPWQIPECISRHGVLIAQYVNNGRNC